MRVAQVILVLIFHFGIVDGTLLCKTNGLFENFNDPHTFWHCVHGTAHLKPCPAYFIWSQSDKICVKPVVATTLTTATTTSSTTLTLTTPSMFPSQCSNYTSITDGTRHVSNRNLVDEKDGSLFSSMPTWVRFEGAAGTRLANYSVSTNHCGSETTGWVKESIEPSVGKTANQTVCLNWTQYRCIWPIKIPMTHCDGFFVYALVAPAIPEARYCTM